MTLTSDYNFCGICCCLGCFYIRASQILQTIHLSLLDQGIYPSAHAENCIEDVIRKERQVLKPEDGDSHHAGTSVIQLLFSVPQLSLLIVLREKPQRIETPVSRFVVSRFLQREGTVSQRISPSSCDTIRLQEKNESQETHSEGTSHCVIEGIELCGRLGRDLDVRKERVDSLLQDVSDCCQHRYSSMFEFRLSPPPQFVLCAQNGGKAEGIEKPRRPLSG
mmetsp:Transcript_29335/g.57579  ORF Transcript_29335/g.57579 Transcript_29335/m.57579 type:complete len:221 (-) Transcript_29335:442-1104(-)